MRRQILPTVMGVLMTAAAVLMVPSSAQAVTLQELIDLSRAGVGDEVLLALIEVDQRVFSIDPATLNKLKQAGLSERVMVAIIKSGRSPQPEIVPGEAPVAMTPSEQPQEPGYREPSPLEPEPSLIREVVVPVPVYVAVATPIYPRRRHVVTTPYVVTPQVGSSLDVFPSPFNTFPPTSASGDHHQKPHKPAEPVYWGWGGKLRPDAWKPK